MASGNEDRPGATSLTDAPVPDLAVPVARDRPTRSPGKIALDRLRSNLPAMIGLAFVVFIGLVAVFAPQIVDALGHPPNQTSVDHLTDNGLPKGHLSGISGSYLFGIEPQTGRDIFSRICYGARVSLGISLTATFLSMVLGLFFGSVAGFFPGKVDAGISRVMDLLLAFPGLLFTISLIGAVPDNVPRPVIIVLVLGGLGWPYIGRLIRTFVLSLREREFVDAARVSGAGEWRILFREVLPNLTGPVLTYTMLLIPGNVVAEAALSYLGVGIRVPTASWGSMLSDASAYYSVDPFYLVVPGLVLFLTVFAFNLFGDGVSEAFNPKSNR
ncbi:MAG: dipeptide transporter superfamily, rane [Frankiales bacterium]|nr:dipeptide transporter superfamily, rane [Frankiales bacterium]